LRGLQPLLLSGREALPLVEGGKGVAVTTGECSGAWAATGAVATISGVNADSLDENGRIVPQVYHGKTRRERHVELIQHGIKGGIAQARIAHERSNGQGRLHMNVLWEMGGCEDILKGVLEGARGLIHGVTCGAGMPYRVAEIASAFDCWYYPIVSSARAFRALWLRSFNRFREKLGGVVYEDPWLAGGHNGLSNSENPERPENPYPRVKALRELMVGFGLGATPIVMAGGVWWLSEWEHWLDNPEIGPVAFQFGSRPLLTMESPIPEAWKRRLTTLREGEVLLNRFSPTGFYSSAVKNAFINELVGRSERQIAFRSEPSEEYSAAFDTGRGKVVHLTPDGRAKAERWAGEGFTETMRTPDETLVFVTPDRAARIHHDQVECMGCLSACRFSNWSQTEPAFSTGRRPDPRSYCIQKTLQAVAHSEDGEHQLMFAGHNAYRFGTDPYYANGFIPTVAQLVDRIQTGY